MIYFISFLILAVFVTNSSAQSIHGIITDNGKPLSFVSVTAIDKDSVILNRTISDSTGLFKFSNIPAHEITLHARSLGYKPNSIKAKANDNLPPYILELKPEAIALKEIDIKSNGIIRKEGFTLITPSRNTIRHSTNGYTLLLRLGIPDIHIDRHTQTVSNFIGDVTLYINGIKASRREVTALRPQDVKNIEYHDFPLGKYAQDKAAINFITHQYTYGGFVSFDGKGTLGHDDDEANGVFKLSKGAKSFTIWSGYRYSDIKKSSVENEILRLPSTEAELSQHKNLTANSLHESYF